MKKFWNTCYDTLYKHCQNIGFVKSSTGAIIVNSNKFTGRAPKFKRIVSNEATKNIWWGDVNMPITESYFNELRKTGQILL